MMWSNCALAGGTRVGLRTGELLFEAASGTANNELSKTRLQISTALVTLPTPGFFDNCLNYLKLKSMASFVRDRISPRIVRETSVLRAPFILPMVRVPASSEISPADSMQPRLSGTMSRRTDVDGRREGGARRFAFLPPRV